jgi:hypothetical protein
METVTAEDTAEDTARVAAVLKTQVKDGVIASLTKARPSTPA